MAPYSILYILKYRWNLTERQKTTPGNCKNNLLRNYLNSFNIFSLDFSSHSGYKLLYHALVTSYHTMLVSLLVHGIYIMIETD